MQRIAPMWNRFLVRWLAALIAVGAMTPLAHADADDADHRLLSVLDADNPTPQRQSAFAYFQ